MSTTLITNLYSNPWQTVRNLLLSNATIASGVLPSMPQKEVVYPLLIVEGADIEQKDKSFGLVHSNKAINIEITCLAPSKIQLDALSDQAQAVIEQNQTVTAASGLKLIACNSSRTQPIELNGEIVHTRVLNANYDWWGSL